MESLSVGSIGRKRCIESFGSAADCLGTVAHGCSVFAVSRGQFSLVDLIYAALDQVGPADVSIWTWRSGAYNFEHIGPLMDRISGGLIIVDAAEAKREGCDFLRQFQKKFGKESIRATRNHAKIATVTTEDIRLLIRGSANLHAKPRFEQFDITEGCPAYYATKSAEIVLPVLAEIADDRKAAARQQNTLNGIKAWRR